MASLHLGAEEQRLLLRIDNVLASVSRMEELEERAFPLLRHLISADLGALACWRPDAGRYDWLGNLPEGWSARYEQLMSYDFVRDAISQSPNVALVDAQMIDRRAKKRSVLYELTRDVQLEQVMSILLTSDGRPTIRPDGLQASITVYRTRDTPFTPGEAAILQQLAAPFRHALERCLRVDRFAAASIDKWLLQCSGVAAVMLGHDMREIARTSGVTELLCRWFPEAPRPGVLPGDLVKEITCRRPIGQTRDFKRESATHILLGWVCERPPALEGVGWLVIFDERALAPAVPPLWRALLTPREHSVVELVIRGLSNADIADELDVQEQSVKQRLLEIFKKLAIGSRTELCARAYQEATRFPDARLAAFDK